MTDSSDPKARPPRRPDASREPPTIDLKAKVVDDGARPSAAAAEEPPVGGGPVQDGIPAAGSEIGSSETVVEPQAATSDEVTPDAPVSDADMSSVQPASETESHTAYGEPREDAPAAHGPATRQSAGFGPLAAAGLLGGLVGGGLVLAYDLFGRDAAQGDPRIAQIEQRLAGLPRGDALQRLESRLGTLEGAQGTINQRLQAAQSQAEKANARAEEVASRPAPAPQTPGPAPQTTQAIADLGNRIGALENQLRERAQAAAAASQTNATAVQALDRRLGEFEKRVGDTDKRFSDLDQRFGEQDQKLAALTRQVAEGGSEATRAGTRVVLADRLNNALREGAPYTDVLAALKRFNLEPARLQPLEPFATRGAPTAASLAQSFKPLSEQMVREARPDGGSWSDRLTRMAERVVTVRSVNDPAGGGSVPDLVARIDHALARGAFADAAAAWDALPEPSRRQSEDWGRQLKQRVAAEAAARAVAADAVAALNPTTR